MSRIYNQWGQKQRRSDLRRALPPAEIFLWERLRGRQLNGLKFRRQYSVGPFITDFYCASARLAIELDGESHFAPGVEAYDANRQAFIESYGIRVLRFSNDQIYRNIEAVLEAIAQHAAER